MMVKSKPVDFQIRVGREIVAGEFASSTYDDVHMIRVTSQMIPDVLYVSNRSRLDNIGMVHDIHVITLRHDVLLEFTDAHMAETFLEILCGDVENVNLKKDYPEIFV